MSQNDLPLPLKVEKEIRPPTKNTQGKNTSTDNVQNRKGEAMNVVQYDRMGDYILYGGQGRDIWLTNTQSLNLVKTYSGGHGREVLDISIAKDNSKFASCGGDRAAILWDVSTGDIIRKLFGHEQKINCLEFNKEDTILATGSMDKTARLWDCRSRARTPIQILDQAKDSLLCIQVTATQIITGSVDGQVRTYDLRKGQLTSDYIGSPVTSVCQSDDGKCLLVTTLDDCIRLFDRYDGSLLNSYRGHKNKNYRIQSRLNNSDEYIATGSEDGSIVIWDLLDANIQRRLHHHQNIVTSVIFHPKDQTRMASASADGSIVLWCK